MEKKKLLLCLFLWIIATTVLSQNGIPDRVGNWRVEVGPPGNEFYEAKEQSANAAPPSDKVMKVVNVFAPDTKMERWRLVQEKYYSIRTRAGYDRFDFIISEDGQLIELEFENRSAKIDEEPDEMIIRNSKRRALLEEIPVAALETIAKIIPQTKPQEAWAVLTPAGPRYAVLADKMVFYSNTGGLIRSAGLIERGALKEIDPPGDKKEKSPEETTAEIKKLLGQYKDIFNFEKRIEQLKKAAPDADRGFRFVVIGDSRSNYDLWENIIKHIESLDPKPAFALNTGDVVPKGLTSEYVEYYIPPLLKTEIPVFVAIGNHDDGQDGTAREFRYLFGENSLNYFFDYGKTRFICFDNVTRVSSLDQRIEWLQKTLANTPKEFSKFVFAHRPPGNIKKWAYHAMRKKHSEIITTLLSKYKVRHSFWGHIHAYSTATFEGVEYTVTGGGGAGLHDRYGALGNIHHYIICDVLPDGTLKQQVARFYYEKEKCTK